MRLLLFIVVLLSFISCKEGTNQKIIETPLKVNDSSNVNDEWVEDFKKLRNAVYDNDIAVIKTYFNFPIQGNEIWELAYWGEEFMPEQEFVDAKKGFKEEDFDKRYNNIFNEHFTKALLKINLDKLFENKSYQATGSGQGISYEIIATVQKNQLKLQFEYNKLHQDPWGNTKAGFTFEGKIKRSDFGLNWNAALETGGVLVSDEVKIAGELQFVKG